MSKAGLHTIRALQAAAQQLQVRRAPVRPSVTRRINAAHREAVGAQPTKPQEKNGGK